MSASSATSSDDAGLTLAQALHAYEAAIDAAYAAGAHLAATAVVTRQALGLSAIVGHKSYRHIDAAQVALSTARSETVDFHRLIGRVAEAIGIDADAPGFGDGGKPPAPTGIADTPDLA